MTNTARTILLILGALVIGAGVFQLGVAQGAATVGQAVPAVAPYLYYMHPFGFGFGFFGLLFPLLFLFVIFGLLRAAFWGGHRGWGGPGWSDHRRTMLEEWHRQAHESGDRGTGTKPTA